VFETGSVLARRASGQADKMTCGQTGKSRKSERASGKAGKRERGQEGQAGKRARRQAGKAGKRQGQAGQLLLAYIANQYVMCPLYFDIIYVIFCFTCICGRRCLSAQLPTRGRGEATSTPDG
jgi:hypothetical protein